MIRNLQGPAPLSDHRAWLTLLLFAFLVLSGCGKAKPQRLAVSGRVTVDGQPLEIGSILFQPEGRGPKSGGMIQGGVFSIAASTGPQAGEYVVGIQAPKLSPGTVLPTEESARFEVLTRNEERLPARYNARSTLRASVTESGPNIFDFDLQTTPERK